MVVALPERDGASWQTQTVTTPLSFGSDHPTAQHREMDLYVGDGVILPGDPTLSGAT